MATRKKSHYPILTCTPKRLPSHAVVEAARIATTINPLNGPRPEGLIDVMRGGGLDAERIGVLTTKYWHTNGVALAVGFLDSPERALRRRILEHMNAWGKSAKVKFSESNVDPQVRIAREDGPQGGYWSYVGTDILLIAKDEPTLNLEAFTMKTPESEFVRVVRHETGHTLGFPHEHMREALVKLIDRNRAFEHFKLTQGWSRAEVISQVLTPIEESALMNPTAPDPKSIMCYQIPGLITTDGKPIAGGHNIGKLDHEYASRIYPKHTRRTARFPEIKRQYSVRGETKPNPPGQTTRRAVLH